MVSAREVRDLLDERPDLEPAVVAALEPEPPWSFHDIDVDSGRFGELVDRGVVEKTDGGYRVPNPEAVARGLTEDGPGVSKAREIELPEITVPVSRLESVYLVAAVLLVVAFRLVALPQVYHADHVVLSGNDPYFYRYWVDQLLADPEVTLSSLPGGVTKGEPLLVATLWLSTLGLGGSVAVGGQVLAWYPVVTAALAGVFVYLAATAITDDRRIGLAAVAMLAVLPAHALRTSLGFADHHPFDYLWLALTVLGITLVAREASHRASPLSRTTIVGAFAVAVGVAAQTLAWDNSPIILAVLGPYLGLEALRAVDAKESPLRTAGPTLAGVIVAAILAWTVHERVGWHTELVASAPLLVAIGGLGVMAAGELFYRLDIRAPALAGTEAVIAVIGAYLLQTFRPEFWARLTTSVEGRLLAPRPIAEVQSIFGESFGWLLLFGFILILALPYLVWATRRAIPDARWLPPVVYAWYFLVLAGIQARFVGEFSPILAIFAGLGFVHLAHLIDVARPPAPFTDADPPDLRLPEPKQAGYLVILFLLVAGLSIVQVPVKTSQIATPLELSDTAFYLADHSDVRHLEYPENYVFSEWGENRVYNYFVSGQSRSYGFAQSNYGDFVSSTDPEGWYDRLSGRAGFVVTTPTPDLDPTQLGAVIHRDNGSRTETHSGLAHYRLIYVSDSGRYKAFELVPGAVLKGSVTPNDTIRATTTVDVTGSSFTYVRQTNADASGNYTIRVAHPGSYRISNATVTVSDTDVWNGSVVRVPTPDA